MYLSLRWIKKAYVYVYVGTEREEGKSGKEGGREITRVGGTDKSHNRAKIRESE